MGVNSIVQQVVRCDGELQPVVVENRIKKADTGLYQQSPKYNPSSESTVVGNDQ